MNLLLNSRIIKRFPSERQKIPDLCINEAVICESYEDFARSSLFWPKQDDKIIKLQNMINSMGKCYRNLIGQCHQKMASFLKGN